MTVRLFEKKDADRWDAYVRRSAEASCYHLSRWKNVIEKSFGHAGWYLLSENKAGEIDGILPLVHMKSLLFGNFMVSLPYFNYGGICADNPDAERRLLQEAIRIAEERKADYIELRQARPLHSGCPVKTAKVTMRRPVCASSEELWKSFGSKLRSQVQRPLREGMYAEAGAEGSLDDFYDVFSANMRDLGTPVYSRDFFKNILHGFPATAWICTVRARDRTPVAAGFFVGFNLILEIPWASSLRRYNRYSPNMLLYWTALRIACQKGYKVFDFGRSTPGEGTFKFKEQWGARPVQLYWHYWMRNGSPLPELNTKNPKYGAAIRIWKKMPLALTKLIGPPIVKNLP